MKKSLIISVFLFIFLATQQGMCSETFIVGIAGGTGSGKTTLAKNIKKRLNDDVLIISSDSYYKDLSHLSLHDRSLQNFDHPDSIDFALLRDDLVTLFKGNSVSIPSYDFVTHSQKKESTKTPPTKIIVVEGILLFAAPELQDVFDLKIYVDTPDDIRLIRRLKRDIEERGRTLESITTQYITTVKPMHDKFVEPSKKYADIIIPEGGHNPKANEVILSLLKKHIG